VEERKRDGKRRRERQDIILEVGEMLVHPRLGGVGTWSAEEMLHSVPLWYFLNEKMILIKMSLYHHYYYYHYHSYKFNFILPLMHSVSVTLTKIFK
jgi:hypothetical protein